MFPTCEALSASSPGIWGRESWWPCPDKSALVQGEVGQKAALPSRVGVTRKSGWWAHAVGALGFLLRLLLTLAPSEISGSRSKFSGGLRLNPSREPHFLTAFLVLPGLKLESTRV